MEPDLTPEQQRLLSFYTVTGLVETAAQLAEVSPTLHAESLQTSRAYKSAYALAQRDSALSLEERARQRALAGTEDPVFHGGEVVGYRQRFSDRLLIFLLQANHPAKFKHHGNLTMESFLRQLKLPGKPRGD